MSGLLPRSPRQGVARNMASRATLADPERAGSAARQLAREAQYAYAKHHWRVLASIAFGVSAAGSCALVFPGWIRGIVFGGFVASAGWLVVIFVIVGSGSASQMMGDMGEQWTAQELRSFDKRGWRVLNHAFLRTGGDIDHIVIGPPGVFVLETKWSATWDARCRPRLAGAVATTARLRHDVWLTAKARCGDAPVRSAVVLWSAKKVDETFTRRPQDAEDTAVLCGHDLAAWLDSHTDDALSPDQIESTHDWLADQIEKRDAYVLALHGRPPRGVGEVAYNVSQYTVGSCGWLLASRYTWLALANARMWLFALCAAGALAYVGVPARRVKRWRPIAMGWLTAAAATLVVTVVTFVGAAVYLVVSG